MGGPVVSIPAYLGRITQWGDYIFVFFVGGLLHRICDLLHGSHCPLAHLLANEALLPIACHSGS